jgi:GAF domain-containing protein
MHKDLEGQLEGMFSDAAADADVRRDESLLEETIDEFLQPEPEAEPAADEPEIKPAVPSVEEIRESERETPEPSPPSAPAWKTVIEEQRARIIDILLGSASGIGAILTGAVLVDLIRDPTRLGAYIIHFAAYAALVTATLARQVRLRLRAVTLLVVIYAVGIISLVQAGSLGPGGFYLLIAPLLCGILVGRRAGAIAAAASALLYTASIVAQHGGWLQPAAAYDLTQLPFAWRLGGIFALATVGLTVAQWMFDQTLTGALGEAVKKGAEAVRSESLLEQRLDELTAEHALLQRRLVQLQVTAEVSRVSTSILDPDELVQQIVTLIQRQLDLYYAGLYLLDESEQWAVLRGGTGEAGRQMLDQGNRLGVGGASLVGQCTANARARIEPDRGAEAVRADNALLPETRSEMALPLRSRGQVIGALDMHSTEPDAFSQEDADALQALADQIAIAIDNARSFSEIEEKVRETEKAQRRYLRERWADVLPAGDGPLYERSRPDVRPLGDTTPPEVERAVKQRALVVQSVTSEEGTEAALVVPIRLRDEVIGALGLQETDGKREWTDDEIALVEAVADQMALAIENARLLAQTQRRAERDRLIANITARVRSSVHLESILQTAVRELGAALGTDRAVVQLTTDADSETVEAKTDSTPPQERSDTGGGKA